MNINLKLKIKQSFFAGWELWCSSRCRWHSSQLLRRTQVSKSRRRSTWVAANLSAVRLESLTTSVKGRHPIQFTDWPDLADPLVRDPPGHSGRCSNVENPNCHHIDLMIPGSHQQRPARAVKLNLRQNEELCSQFFSQPRFFSLFFFSFHFNTSLSSPLTHFLILFCFYHVPMYPQPQHPNVKFMSIIIYVPKPQITKLPQLPLISFTSSSHSFIKWSLVKRYIRASLYFPL